ncbi:MAG: GIY-YIG nuclease family protein [Desulfatiglandales bacterium]
MTILDLQISQDVTFGQMFPDTCPPSLRHVMAGRIQGGAFFSSSSVAWHFWDLEHENQKMKADQQHIYFIQAVNGGPIKIGLAKNPKARLSELQTAHPYELHIVGVIPNGGKLLESSLHKQFANERLNGEWFKESHSLLEVIREARA